MNIITRTTRWGSAHHPKIIDIVRILLGVLLVVRSYVYFTNRGYIRELVVTTQAIRQSPAAIWALINYSTYIQLVCGIMLLLGLRTRIAAIILVPLIFGAIFFVNILNPFFNAELWLSIMVMALLVMFIVLGSGPISLDRLFANMKIKDE